MLNVSQVSNQSDTLNTNYVQSGPTKEYFIAMTVFRYFPPFTIIIGTVTNIISFIVFSRPAMKMSVSSFYFRVLAIVDTLVLWTNVTGIWIAATFNYQIYTSHTIVCKMQPFLSYLTSDLSGWTLSCVTVDRCIGLYYPHKYRQLCTKFRAKRVMLIIFLLLAGKNAYFLEAMNIRITSGNRHCEQRDDPMFVLMWDYIDFFTFCGFPFAIIITCNVMIIYKVTIASYRRRHQMAREKTSTSGLTSTLIIVSFVYLFLTAPLCLVVIVYNSLTAYLTWKLVSQLYLYNAIASVCAHINSAGNLFLYCIGGSHFRNELVKMLKCKL